MAVHVFCFGNGDSDVPVGDEPQSPRIQTIDAYRSDEQPHRITRLHEVVGFLAAKGLDGRSIRALHDHKGILTVTWKQEPSDGDKKIVEDAWDWQNEIEIEHEVRP